MNIYFLLLLHLYFVARTWLRSDGARLARRLVVIGNFTLDGVSTNIAEYDDTAAEYANLLH